MLLHADLRLKMLFIFPSVNARSAKKITCTHVSKKKTEQVKLVLFFNKLRCQTSHAVVSFKFKHQKLSSWMFCNQQKTNFQRVGRDAAAGTKLRLLEAQVHRSTTNRGFVQVKKKSRSSVFLFFFTPHDKMGGRFSHVIDLEGGGGGPTVCVCGASTGRRAGWGSAEADSLGTPSGSCGAFLWPTPSSGWSPPGWRRPRANTGSSRWIRATSPAEERTHGTVTHGNMRTLPLYSSPVFGGRVSERDSSTVIRRHLVGVVGTRHQQEDPGEWVLGRVRDLSGLRAWRNKTGQRHYALQEVRGFCCNIHTVH